MSDGASPRREQADARRISSQDLLDLRDLRELREKYARMLVLRQLHARSREEPNFVEPDPRPEMIALAERWPGALREIDELDLTTVIGRIDALDRALEAHVPNDATIEPWMVAQARFHRLLRGALAVKRWLGRTGREPSTTADVRARLLDAISNQRLSDDAALWVDDVASIVRPPGGRLLVLVFTRLERELGLPALELRESVFGGARPRGRV